MMPKSKRRVVITGMGAVTALGGDFASTWAGVLAGTNPAAPIKAFPAGLYATNFAYEVNNFVFDDRWLIEGEEAVLNRAAEFGVTCGIEALSQAGLLGEGAAMDPARRQVIIGAGMNAPDFSWHDDVLVRGNRDPLRLAVMQRYYPENLALVLARLSGAKGQVSTVHTACASSGQALGEAFEAVAYGEADMVLTGGVDSMICPFALAGFSLLGAMSKRTDAYQSACRPFDQARDGFVLGEGGVILVFEELQHALRRGAPILGEVAGYGVTESAYRITDLHPEGVGPIEAMQMALNDAGIKPHEVGYINAHGTSTLINDRVEALAISRVFGQGPNAPLVSSTKPMTGHMISAAGAMEFAFCVAAIKDQVVPASLNVSNLDPECRINLIGSEPAKLELSYALSNSVGFGGSNTALIAKRYLP